MLPLSTFKEYLFPRRMLLHSPYVIHPQPPQPPPLPPPPPPELYSTSKHGISFDADVVMVFSVLLCLLVFSIFVNCVIRCLFKCLIWLHTRQMANNNNNKVEVIRGVHKRALRSFPVVKYSKEVKLQGLSGECVICLSEFKEGERVRILPKCTHGFHVKCIDKWLGSHSSCPTCRQSLVDTCQKIVGCDDDHQASSSSSSREMIGIRVESLEREDFVRNI